MNAKQQVFVSAYIGPAKKNATEAARIAGYKQPQMHGWRLMQNDDVKAAIAAHLAAIDRQGIAHQQNRIDALVRRHRLLEQVVNERAADAFVADVPGGKTGLIVKQLKRVKHIYLPDPDDEDGRASVEVEDQWEAAVDTGLLKELRDHEKQVAQELGEWTEKREIGGMGGAPVLLEIRNIVVPLPAPDDESDSDG
jgi:phage terminase small subunit